MTLIKDGSGDIATFDYELDRSPKTVSYANGITLSLTYNGLGLEWIRDYVKTSSVYKPTTEPYDHNGNVTTETALRGAASIARDYTYDAQDRIKTETKNGPTIGTWSYDAVGNWTATTQNGLSESRAANNDNEYTSITGMTPAHDVHGNLSSDGTRSYVYDWQNRLVEVWVSGQQVAKYTYDALNRRVSKSTPLTSGVTTYYYDNAQVIEEHEEDNYKRAYVYGQYVDDPLMMESGGQDYFYLKDRQYGIRAIADASGNEVERYEYSAFGRMTVYRYSGGNWVETPESQIGNTYGYTGRQWDKESGLWYYRNRMYSPTIGRFLQRDPAGYVDGMNLYAYVRNNALKYLDPMGLMTQEQSQQQQSSANFQPPVWEPTTLPSANNQPPVSQPTTLPSNTTLSSPVVTTDFSAANFAPDIGGQAQATNLAVMYAKFESAVKPYLVGGALVVTGGFTAAAGGITSVVGFTSIPTTGPAGALVTVVGGSVAVTGGGIFALGLDVYADELRYRLGLPKWFDVIRDFELVPKH